MARGIRERSDALPRPDVVVRKGGGHLLADIKSGALDGRPKPADRYGSPRECGTHLGHVEPLAFLFGEFAGVSHRSIQTCGLSRFRQGVPLSPALERARRADSRTHETTRCDRHSSRASSRAENGDGIVGARATVAGRSGASVPRRTNHRWIVGRFPVPLSFACSPRLHRGCGPDGSSIVHLIGQSRARQALRSTRIERGCLRAS